MPTLFPTASLLTSIPAPSDGDNLVASSVDVAFQDIINGMQWQAISASANNYWASFPTVYSENSRSIYIGPYSAVIDNQVYTNTANLTLLNVNTGSATNNSLYYIYATASLGSQGWFLSATPPQQGQFYPGIPDQLFLQGIYLSGSTNKIQPFVRFPSKTLLTTPYLPVSAPTSNWNYLVGSSTTFTQLYFAPFVPAYVREIGCKVFFNSTASYITTFSIDGTIPGTITEIYSYTTGVNNQVAGAVDVNLVISSSAIYFMTNTGGSTTQFYVTSWTEMQ